MITLADLINYAQENGMSLETTFIFYAATDGSGGSDGSGYYTALSFSGYAGATIPADYAEDPGKLEEVNVLYLD